MKKHTKNVWTELEETAIATIYKSQKNYEQIKADADTFKALPLENMEAFQLMGVLFGHNFVSPRQLTVLKSEWLRPGYEEFRPRNMWSFYNACTKSLKSCPPVSIMEKHIQLHNTILKLTN
jgi:hypothetical protein